MLIEKLCTKEENDKTGCNFNFGRVCIYAKYNIYENYDITTRYGGIQNGGLFQPVYVGVL